MIYTMMSRGLRPNYIVRPEMMMDHMMRGMCMPPHPHGGPRHPHRPMGFPVNVKKADNAYILTAAVPGVKLDAIAITVENDVLTIAAQLPRVPREELQDYIICERGVHPHMVERSFRLEGIDQSAITASAADGILTVTLPKEAPAEGKGPRRIAISARADVPAIEAAAE